MPINQINEPTTETVVFYQDHGSDEWEHSGTNLSARDVEAIAADADTARVLIVEIPASTRQPAPIIRVKLA